MGPSHITTAFWPIIQLFIYLVLSLHNLSEKNPMLDLKLTFSFRNLFSSKKEQLESDKAFRLNVRSIYLVSRGGGGRRLLDACLYLVLPLG